MADYDLTSDLTSGDFDSAPQHGALPDTQAAPVNRPADTIPSHERPADPPASTDAASLRDALTDAFKEPDANAEPAAAAAPVVQAPALEQDAEGKFRHLDGTYASQGEIDAFNAAKGQAAPTAAVDANVLTSLTPVEQEQFKALPPELQQYVARTTQALNERATRYNEFDALEQHVLGPRRAAFAQDGLSAPQAVAELFKLSDFAAADPAQFITWFAQQRGIDLDALLDQMDEQGQINPEIAALQGQVAQLTQTVQTFTSREQEQAHNANIQAVEAVATEKDETGALKRPYFEQLGDDILPFVQAARTAHPDKNAAEVLSIAYDNACWSNSTIRQQMQNTVPPKPQNVPDEHAKRAANASASINGSPTGDPSTSPNNSNRSLREEIEYNLRASS
jgi:hypothetical protein